MQRLPTLVLLTARAAPLSASRAFSTSPLALAKGKKRTHWNPSSGAAAPPSYAPTTPGQAGTDVGHAAPAPGAGGGGLFEADPQAQGQAEKVDEVSPEQLEREMLAAQGPLRRDVDGQGERENLAGTDVGQGGGKDQATAQTQAGQGEYGPEEVIYTSTPPFNTALMLTVSLVMGVFAFAAGDFARVGVETYDEQTGEYKLASPWKRYTFAAGAFATGTAIVVYGSLAPTRLITKIALRRSPSSLTSPYPFPRDSLVVLSNPLSPMLAKVGVKPRTVPLSRMRLLGALTDSKSYHPLIQQEAAKRPSRLERLLNAVWPVPSSSNSSARKTIRKGSHAPFVIEGDRATYSLALKRAREPFAKDGAWCKDWDALERALLGVDESKWAKGR